MFHPKGPSLYELIKQGLSSTKEGYDQLAPKFDYTPFLTPYWMIEEVMARLVMLNGGKFKDAADLCTGTGAALEGLKEIVSGRLFGIDWSAPMLCEAVQKYGRVEQPEIFFRREDIFLMDESDKFDLVTCFGALGHIPPEKQTAFIQKVLGILKPSGLFAFVTSEKPKWYHARSWPYFAFDAVMKIRNHFIKPEFVMYYINFLLPEILDLFTIEDWSEVKIIPLEYNGKKTGLRLVVARKSEQYGGLYPVTWK